MSLCASLGAICVDKCLVFLYLCNNAVRILVQSPSLNLTRSCIILLMVLVDPSATLACVNVVVYCLPSPSRDSPTGINAP